MQLELIVSYIKIGTKICSNEQNKNNNKKSLAVLMSTGKKLMKYAKKLYFIQMNI